MALCSTEMHVDPCTGLQYFEDVCCQEKAKLYIEVGGFQVDIERVSECEDTVRDGESDDESRKDDTTMKPGCSLQSRSSVTDSVMIDDFNKRIILH